jgi:ubiquitin-conjugating enzyme E2 Q
VSSVLTIINKDTSEYQPSKEHVVTSLRRYGLQSDQQSGIVEEYIDIDKRSETGLTEDDGTFDKFSLSSSLESLPDEHFL